MKTFARAMRGSRLGRWWLAALALAASAVLIQRKSRAVEADYPPLGTFLDVDGVRLHVLMRGKGEPLLLLHGNGSNVLDLELSGLLERAAERYQVIAIDRPGFGYSSRPRGTVWTPQAQARLIHRALAQLGVVRPIVAAHSLGTQVALALALAVPRRRPQSGAAVGLLLPITEAGSGAVDTRDAIDRGAAATHTRSVDRSPDMAAATAAAVRSGRGDAVVPGLSCVDVAATRRAARDRCGKRARADGCCRASTTLSRTDGARRHPRRGGRSFHRPRLEFRPAASRVADERTDACARRRAHGASHRARRSDDCNRRGLGRAMADRCDAAFGPVRPHRTRAARRSAGQLAAASCAARRPGLARFDPCSCATASAPVHNAAAPPYLPSMLTFAPLTPERRGDYLDFFDTRAFTDNPRWASCYCFFPLHDPSRTNWKARSAAENRADVADCIAQGSTRGVLAYHDEEVVGWCNAGPWSLYPMLRDTPEADFETLGVIFCFIVAPAWRRRKVATGLLHAACEALRASGMTAVQARSAQIEHGCRCQSSRPAGDVSGRRLQHRSRRRRRRRRRP